MATGVHHPQRHLTNKSDHATVFQASSVDSPDAPRAAHLVWDLKSARCSHFVWENNTDLNDLDARLQTPVQHKSSSMHTSSSRIYAYACHVRLNAMCA